MGKAQVDPKNKLGFHVLLVSWDKAFRVAQRRVHVFVQLHLPVITPPSSHQRRSPKSLFPLWHEPCGLVIQGSISMFMFPFYELHAFSIWILTLIFYYYEVKEKKRGRRLYYLTLEKEERQGMWRSGGRNERRVLRFALR